MHSVVCSKLRIKRLKLAESGCCLLAFTFLWGLECSDVLYAQDNNQSLQPVNTGTAGNEQHEANDQRTLRNLGDVGQDQEWEMEIPSSVSDSEQSSVPVSTKVEIDRNLAAARKAMQEGRIDQPETDSAWFYYRSASDLDSRNSEAHAGLLAVQREMISRALEYARELDFESADRLLDDAALVRESQVFLNEAYEEIASFRNRRAEELEIAAVTAMDSGNFNRAERVLIELIALGGADTVVNQLRRRLEEARIYGGFRPGQVIRDHFLNQGRWTPDSVVVMAGSFMMGSSAFESGRKDNEGPQHRVIFRRGFAIGQRELSVGEFRVFTELTGYKTDAEKNGWSTVYDQYSGRLTRKDGVDWKSNYEGHEAENNEPVIHVSWNDATAYVNWLARGTGKSYRLPSEAEFEYVLRGGKTSLYWWGDGSPADVVENLTGEGDSSRSRRRWSTFFEGYSDHHWGPAPVGSLKANPYGIYDIGGNVGEWVRDCWHETYIRAPLDGTSWINPGCKLRVIRGGYWASSPDQTRAAFRLSAQTDRRDARIGFRIARDL